MLVSVVAGAKAQKPSPPRNRGGQFALVQICGRIIAAWILYADNENGVGGHLTKVIIIRKGDCG